MDKTTPHPLFKLATELGPLVIFFIAGLLHILHGEFDIGVLLVYAMAVLVSMAYRTGKLEAAHDRP